jgi:hypothetical protein
MSRAKRIGRRGEEEPEEGTAIVNGALREPGLDHRPEFHEAAASLSD